MRTNVVRQMNSMMMIVVALTSLVPSAGVRAATIASAQISAADKPSLQTAIDENREGIIVVHPGDHKIRHSLIIRHEGTVSADFGRILQTNTSASIVRIDYVNNVVLQG